MADVFYNPTPIVTPSGDKWSQPRATGDRWAYIQAANDHDSAWHIQNDWEVDTSWMIQMLMEEDTAWHIQNEATNGITSWHIQAPHEFDTAWHIYPELVIYFGPLFKHHPNQSTFKITTNNFSYALPLLQTDFSILEELVTTHSLAYSLIDAFNAIAGQTSIEIDADLVPDTRQIQPIEKGLVNPYEDV